MYTDLLEKFKERNPNKQLILLYQAGSHFFDLNGPDSDTDYRGIYLDNVQDSFLSSKGKIYQIDYKTNERGGKNNKEDIDFTMFSLTSVLELLKKGDFNLIEALYVPEEKIIYKSEIYDELREFRKNLVHNDISAFLGFIKGEAKRIGVNSHHYTVQADFVKLLRTKNPHAKLKTFWKEIEEFASVNIGCKMSRSTVNNSDLARDMPAVVIATRMHIWTAAAGYVADAVDKVIAGYGHRQVSTSETGADHKALYHALRLIFEANDILDYGELFFPLSPERHAQLLEIKQGKTDRETLYDLIDSEISKLEIRSNSIPSNKHEYEYKLDNMIFTLKGKFMVNNYLKGLRKPVDKQRISGHR